MSNRWRMRWMSWRRTPLRTLTVISLMLAYTQCSAFTYTEQTHTHIYPPPPYTLIQNMRAHSQRFVPLLHPPAWPRPSSQLRTTVTTLMLKLGAILMWLSYHPTRSACLVHSLCLFRCCRCSINKIFHFIPSSEHHSEPISPCSILCYGPQFTCTCVFCFIYLYSN